MYLSFRKNKKQRHKWVMHKPVIRVQKAKLSVFCVMCVINTYLCILCVTLSASENIWLVVYSAKEAPLKL